MKRYLIGITSAVLLLGMTKFALAHTIRVPASGAPALIAKVPDSWTIGEAHHGMLDVIDQYPAHIAITFNLLADPRSPGNFVDEEMHSAGGKIPIKKGRITIAGFKGWLFESTGRSQSGRKIIIRQYVARVNKKFLIAVAVLISADGSQRYQKLVTKILASVKVIGNVSRA